MQDTVITLQGYLGSDVTIRMAGDAPVASFRVGSTPRRFDRRDNTWSDAPTQWYTVNAWRSLAENAALSLKRRDPVVVHGRLVAKTWVNKDNVEVTSYEVEASFLGHDLNRGTTRFDKSQRPGDPQQPAAPATAVAEPQEVAA